jgi:CHAT domain-containing protein
VWWCPTGVLSFLPLHAAGIYSDSGSESVLDYVVSSYTPSISSLLERVRNDREIDETRSGLFLTNQPKVPGYPRIAGTTREVNTIHDIATERGVRVLKVEGSELSVDDCLKYMEEYSSVHFACHGSQNAEEPLKSRLRLEKGALELGAIMQKNLKHADFAFLSACETSTGEEKLDNEVVHLAAGMLAAGYRRVVGTMWEIRDSHAVDVANDFYSYLMDHRKDGSGSRFDGSRSAHALHHAVRQLRVRIDDAREVRGIPDELEKSLLLWIPYVHYGY